MGYVSGPNGILDKIREYGELREADIFIRGNTEKGVKLYFNNGYLFSVASWRDNNEELIIFFDLGKGIVEGIRHFNRYYELDGLVAFFDGNILIYQNEKIQRVVKGIERP